MSVILTLSKVEGGRPPAFAFVVVSLLSLLLHLFLSLLVFAVILSEAKDLEELNSPRTIGYFNPFVIAFACSLPPEPKICHFDRSCLQSHRE
jgi:hypothetical protein